VGQGGSFLPISVYSHLAQSLLGNRKFAISRFPRKLAALMGCLPRQDVEFSADR
jgi:hypothetical protein